jgi:predicted GNAT family acetyltransferase
MTSMSERTYRFLAQEEQHDTVISFYLAQERDHHCHMLNHTRYTELLQSLNPEDPFYQRVSTLLLETESRLTEVELIMDTTEPQLPKTQEECDASLQRLKDKGQI